MLKLICNLIHIKINTPNVKHSETKRMDFQEVDSNTLLGAPPVLPWTLFADWIGLGDEPQVVRGWLDRGYLPSIRIGKRLMVNVELFRKELTEDE